MMSVQKEISYRLGRRLGQQGPLHEVRGVPSVVTASTSKTIQKVRGVPPVVDASTSKTQKEDTGLSCTSATNDPRSQRHQRPTSISKCNRKNCLTCPIFKPETMFRSSVTGKTYKVIGSWTKALVLIVKKKQLLKKNGTCSATFTVVILYTRPKKSITSACFSLNS